METTDLQHFHCPRYEELPSLALYMDQVLILVNEITAPLRGATDPVCTATMVNNYVKLKLLAAAQIGQLDLRQLIQRRKPEHAQKIRRGAI